jgi:magnesium chelatase family protein
VSLARITSRALAGTDAPEVTVEVHLANGLPSLTLVGLPDTEVKESRERVRAAIQLAGFEFPNRRVTINLAPADLPKDSGRFDLPIALGILAASVQIDAARLAEYEFAGHQCSLFGASRWQYQFGADLAGVQCQRSGECPAHRSQFARE